MTGCLRPLGRTAHPLIVTAICVLATNIASAQSHFSQCLNGSGNIFNATLVIPTSSTPDVNGTPLPAGSEVGIFGTDPSFSDVCVGLVSWQQTSAAVTVWGDDELTLARDGLISGEQLRFRVWDVSTGTEYTDAEISVSYSVGNGLFGFDKTFVLSNISISTPLSTGVHPDVSTTQEDTPVDIPVLANDRDPDGNPFDPATLKITRAPAWGAIESIDPSTGDVSYRPNVNFNGSDSFDYRVRDVSGIPSASVTVAVTIIPVNDAPNAANDRSVSNEDVALVLDVLINDEDPDGDLIWIGEISTPSHGLASISQDEQSIGYIPEADFFGSDSLVYSISDPDGLTSQGLVIISILPVNDPAVFTSIPQTSAVPNLPYRYIARVEDVDGDPLSITARSVPPWLSIVDTGDSWLTLEGAPSPSEMGVYDVLLEVSDGVVTVEQQFSIDVSDVSTPLTIAVEPSLPAYGALNIPTDPQLTWIPITDATSYHVQVTRDEDDSFLNPVVNDSTILGSVGASGDIVYQSAALDEGTRYRWRVRGRNAGGTSPWSEASRFTTEGLSSTPTEDAPELPAVAELYQNYPNPFNPSTTIAFDLPQTSDVTLTIYDLMGRRIATLVSGTLPAGRHEVRWDAGNNASGVYLYRIRAGTYTRSKTLSLVK